LAGQEHSAGNHSHDGPAVGIWSVEHLVEHLRQYVCERAVLVCIGNNLCGDDGAGPAVAEKLADRVCWDVFDTQTVPESFLVKITNRKPDVVIVVDALHFGAEPGAVELIEAENLSGQGPSTHGPAPLAFLDVLKMFHPCRTIVLGVQPKQAGFGELMSPEVADAVDRIVQAFLNLA